MTPNLNDRHRNILKGYNMLLYFSGTMIMFDPSQECIHDFWTKGILKNLPVTSHNPRFLLAASQLRQSVKDASDNIKIMRKDFLDLFTGTGNPLAPPYESVYKSKDHLMFDKQTAEVRDFYNTYGWESKFKGNIPDDHLGIEMLFLTLMIEKYLEFEDKTCEDEMKNEIKRFIDKHLLSWIPQWNAHIQEHSQTLGYKGIGNLVYASIEDIYGLMSPKGQIKN
jgi:TorA maturation chaperone TorD